MYSQYPHITQSDYSTNTLITRRRREPCEYQPCNARDWCKCINRTWNRSTSSLALGDANRRQVKRTTWAASCQPNRHRAFALRERSALKRNGRERRLLCECAAQRKKLRDDALARAECQALTGALVQSLREGGVHRVLIGCGGRRGYAHPVAAAAAILGAARLKTLTLGAPRGG
eukprot:3543882-Prymnesium_polylepis.2